MLVSRSHMTAVDLTLLDGFSTLATTDARSGLRIDIMARQTDKDREVDRFSMRVTEYFSPGLDPMSSIVRPVRRSMSGCEVAALTP
jgi:hypothetical protein